MRCPEADKRSGIYRKRIFQVVSGGGVFRVHQGNRLMGRKQFVWNDEVYEKVKTGAAFGLNYRQIAKSIGCCYETFRVKRNQKTGKYSALSAAIEEGRMQGQLSIGSALFKKAKAGNVQAMTYYLDKSDFMEHEDGDDEIKTLNIIHSFPKPEESDSQD